MIIIIAVREIYCNAVLSSFIGSWQVLLLCVALASALRILHILYIGTCLLFISIVSMYYMYIVYGTVDIVIMYCWNIKTRYNTYGLRQPIPIRINVQFYICKYRYVTAVDMQCRDATVAENQFSGCQIIKIWTCIMLPRSPLKLPITLCLPRGQHNYYNI